MKYLFKIEDNSKLQQKQNIKYLNSIIELPSLIKLGILLN